MTYMRPFPDAARAERAEPAPRARPAAEPPVHDARLLTAGGPEARIVLDGVAYTLRVTRLRKLILTK